MALREVSIDTLPPELRRSHCRIVKKHPITYIRLMRSPYITIDDELIRSDLAMVSMGIAIDWVKENFKHGRTLLECSSNTLLNYLARNTGIYLSNNAFKDLMWICGFKPIDSSCVNWFFKISVKCPAYNYQFIKPKCLIYTDRSKLQRKNVIGVEQLTLF